MSEELAKEISKLSKALASAHKVMNELKEKHRGMCEHSRSSYYSDASGNNGSYYECNECEKYAKYGFPNSKVTGRY